jgi:hypothetical protein
MAGGDINLECLCHDTAHREDGHRPVSNMIGAIEVVTEGTTRNNRDKPKRHAKHAGSNGMASFMHHKNPFQPGHARTAKANTSPLVRVPVSSSLCAHQICRDIRRKPPGEPRPWLLRCYPAGTGAYIDRFVAWFNDVMRLATASCAGMRRPTSSRELDGASGETPVPGGYSAGTLAARWAAVLPGRGIQNQRYSTPAITPPKSCAIR